MKSEIPYKIYLKLTGGLCCWPWQVAAARRAVVLLGNLQRCMTKQ